MNVKFGILIFLVGVVLAEPARAATSISLCVTTGKGAPIQIKKAKTGDRLVPLKSGDLIYEMADGDRSRTFAFRQGKFTEIVLEAKLGNEEEGQAKMEPLQKKHLVNCANAPKSAKYPIIVRNDPSDAQLIYDEFGIITADFTLNKVRRLGKYSRCPILEYPLFVSGWKLRELKSKGVPLVRFCAAMSDNSWFWFDPETGQRRAYFQMRLGKRELGAEHFFKPIPCFLSAETRIDLKAQQIRPSGCVFRYNPLTGTPLSEKEGRALAKLAVFSFGVGERGGTIEDPERLGSQSPRRLSPATIKLIK